MNKVSIIIPVYNAEKFIKRCLDSVLNQTYKNIELVLINDGSTDNSLELINEYIEKYSNVFVWTQKNQGPGEARNVGITYATGDYVTFVDADDYIERDYVENLVSKSKNMDIVICGYKRYDTNLKLSLTKYPIGEDIDFFKFISTVCKLYKRKFLINHNIHFSTRKIGEDMLFTLKCYSLTNKIEKVQYAGYCNIENKKSITHTSSNNVADMFSLVKEVEETIDLKKYGDLYLYFYLKTIIMNLLMQPNKMNFKSYFQVYKDSFDWLDTIYNKNNKNMKLKWVKYEDFHVNAIVNLFIYLRKIHLIRPFLYVLQKINIKL